MSYNNPRIQIGQSFLDSVTALAENNPGALTVLLEIAKEASSIDPDDAFGAFGPMMQLDNLDIYGSKIWMLYKDVCKQDLASMLAVLRANAFGMLSEQQIKTAMDNYGEGVDVIDVLQQVRAKLPNFAKA